MKKFILVLVLVGILSGNSVFAIANCNNAIEELHGNDQRIILKQKTLIAENIEQKNQIIALNLRVAQLEQMVQKNKSLMEQVVSMLSTLQGLILSLFSKVLTGI